MSNLKTTDDLWQELCDAAVTPAAPAPLAPHVHPFAKLGPKPYRFEGVETATGGRHCALCGKAIKNLYVIADGENALHVLGSECILGMSNGFETAIVAQVKTRKREFDRQKRAAAKIRKAEREAVEFRATYPKEVAWLDAYKGNFEFYLSLKEQFQTKGFLSDNQVAALTRAVARDESRASAPQVARTFSLKAGETLIVSKFLAYKIGESFNLGRRPHFAIEVVECLGESEKAWKVKAKLAAKRMVRCACCGTPLENAESRARGIGPICAEKWGVDTIESLGAMLKEKYDTVVCEFWVPKSQVKERV